jgi:hypothetical protein
VANNRPRKVSAFKNSVELCALLFWNLRALLPRFGEPDRDCLLATFHDSSLTTLAGTKRAFFLAANRAFDTLDRRISGVKPYSSFLWPFHPPLNEATEAGAG